MPIMDVRYPEGGLDAPAKEALARRLTDVLIAMEGGANTAGGRAFAWVLFTEIPKGDWWIGGQHVAPPGAFLVHVTIPEGYMNTTHKTEVHAQVTDAIRQVLPTPARADAGPGVLVVIDEVTEGNWGAGGKTISLEAIADSVGLPKDGPRFKWVQAYFQAKARQFAAAGYPADTGGLPPSASDGK